MTADARARFRIEGEDATGPAFRSVEAKIGGLTRQIGGLRQAMTFGPIGGVSLIGLTTFTVRLADVAQQARDTTDSLDEARDAMGRWASAIDSEDVENLASLGDAFDRLADSGRAFGATILSAVSPALSQLADGLRTLMGGATELEKLEVALAYLGRVKDRPEGILNAGGAFGLNSGWNSRSQVREAFGRLSAERDALLAQMDAMRSGRVVGNLGEVTATGQRITSGATRGPSAADSRLEAENRRLNDILIRQMNSGLVERMSAVPGELGGVGSLTDLSAVTAEQIGKVNEALAGSGDELRELSVYAEQASRNMQDALADFFMNADGGFKGLARSLLQTFAQMASQQLAKGLLESSGITGFLGSIFGGARAMGGPVIGGRAYLVGERGPELMVPGASGTVVPNHALAGSTTNINYAPVIGGVDNVSREELVMVLQRHSRELVRAIADDQHRKGHRF